MFRDRNVDIKIGHFSFENVEKLNYLLVTGINDTREEIKRRINMRNARRYWVEKLSSSSLLSKMLKVRIYKTISRIRCNATVTLSEDGSSVVKEPSEHKNHSADWGRIKAKECEENMKARAGTSREPTSVIIKNELQRIASEANVNLPKKPSIKKLCAVPGSSTYHLNQGI
ncbi:hypothetical protein ANN_10442 [Periplaneta americana]|uniref:Uncharacterized protein n=1 Tax=Periplaneta americana TaxID=6978 RepID=A0ABQ8TRB1_PERAM|nr:hypothetical protein ANN_10442 [Periplaneta americana]